MTTSANFSFLAAHDAQLVRLGTQAERYFKEDPVTSLIKLRRYGEALAQIVAAKAAPDHDPAENQSDLLRRLTFDRILPLAVADPPLRSGIASGARVLFLEGRILRRNSVSIALPPRFMGESSSVFHCRRSTRHCINLVDLVARQLRLLK
jgi:hypothetical protein